MQIFARSNVVVRFIALCCFLNIVAAFAEQAAATIVTSSDALASIGASNPATAVTQVGSKTVTLSWAPPTENSNGTPLTNLAGYHIEYGTSRTSLTHKINVNSVGLTTYVIGNLSSGTYYFAITAYNSSGVQSKLSNIVSAKF